MRKRHPRIGIRSHPLSLDMEPARLRATERGEVIHHALSSLGAPAAGAEVESTVMDALAILDLDPGDWRIKQDFVDPVKRILDLPEVARWFGKDVSSLTEAEIMDPAGEVVRPDRIVVAGSEVHVIDFKVGLREEAHREQISKYVELLRGIFAGKRVTGFLVYVDEPAIVEMK